MPDWAAGREVVIIERGVRVGVCTDELDEFLVIPTVPQPPIRRTATAMANALIVRGPLVMPHSK